VNILHGNPRQDCLVQWVEGGVYPRADQEQCIAEFKRTGDLLPPIKEFGHVAVAGMTRYRSEGFGPEYQNNLFITFFNRHKVIRSILERSGSTFISREEEFLSSDDKDFHPTDVFEDADGSLLVIDTGGWFRIGCPVSEIAKPDLLGAIYRIRKKGMKKVEDPRGLRLDFADLPPDDLVVLLDDPRPVVRDRSIDRLATWQPWPSAVNLLTESTSAQAEFVSRRQRRNAVWAISRLICDPSASEFARSNMEFALHLVLHNDPTETVRLTAAHAIAHSGEWALPELYRAAVEDRSPAVRAAASVATWKVSNRWKQRVADAIAADDLGKLVQRVSNRRSRQDPDLQKVAANARFAAPEPVIPDPTPIIVRTFESIRRGEFDRYLEHALIFGLIQIGAREQTLPFLKDPNPQVRRAALIALDQMDDGKLTREEVTPLLDTDDPQLRKAALAVISSRKGWATELVGLLRGWLREAQPSEEHLSLLRGTLLAQTSDPAIQQLIGEALGNDRTSAPVRLLLWEVIDRAPLLELPEAWLEAIGRTLQTGPLAEIRQVIGIVGERKLERFDEAVLMTARNKQAASELRVEALAAVAPRLESMDDEAFALLVDHLKGESPPLVLLAAARGLADAALGDSQLRTLNGSLPTAGPLALPVLLRAYQRTSDEAVGTALVAALNRSPAVDNLSAEELAGILRKYPERVQTEAAALLKRLGGGSLANQKARLKELARLLDPPGDAKQGREVFFSKKAGCANCHTINGEGGRVGPDLTKIGGSRSGIDLLEAIIFPSASFAREFRPYVIATEDGKSVTGIVSRQTADAIHLRTADLAEIRIPRAAIEEMKESNTSIMPKGLDTTLSSTELRNLLAYLQQLK
jgi:putative heme-binding domain-containing protein